MFVTICGRFCLNGGCIADLDYVN
ncbi:hypothetical protein [Anaerobutyricum hallii]